MIERSPYFYGMTCPKTKERSGDKPYIHACNMNCHWFSWDEVASRYECRWPGNKGQIIYAGKAVQ